MRHNFKSLLAQNVPYEAGLRGVRLFNGISGTRITRSVTMPEGRWYPSLVQTADDKVIIAGGTLDAGNNYKGATTIEIFTPATPTASPLPRFVMPKAYLDSFSGKPFYPFMWTLPTGECKIHSCACN
jgi:hypothetical protein